MGTIADWAHVLFVGLIYGVFQAAKVPLKRSDNLGPSTLVWVECALAGLGMGMVFAFDVRALFHIPLVLIFIPVLAVDLLLARYLRKISTLAPDS